MSVFEVGDRVVVKSYPVKKIVGLTGTIEEINPNGHYTKNIVKFDVPLDPSGVEHGWFADEDLEAIEHD